MKKLHPPDFVDFRPADSILVVLGCSCGGHAISFGSTSLYVQVSRNTSIDEVLVVFAVVQVEVASLTPEKPALEDFAVFVDKKPVHMEHFEEG